MHEEIINLIESPDLREHLLHNPQLLSGDHYTQIIGGASIEINRKRPSAARQAKPLIGTDQRFVSTTSMTA